MGVYDIIIWKGRCPHCKRIKTSKGQTKAFDCELQIYRKGDKFLHYPKTTGKLVIDGWCPKCKKVFYGVLEIEKGVIGRTLKTCSFEKGITVK